MTYLWYLHHLEEDVASCEIYRLKKEASLHVWNVAKKWICLVILGCQVQLNNNQYIIEK